MDPPPRSHARRSVSLLHGRGPLDPTDYKRVARAPAHTRQAPLGSSVEPYPIVTACRRPHVRQGQGPFRAALKNAPSLTAAARVGFGILAVGAEESLRRGRTKERAKKAKKEKEKVVLRAPP
jgi:hypothetical protein